MTAKGSAQLSMKAASGKEARMKRGTCTEEDEISRHNSVHSTDRTPQINGLQMDNQMFFLRQ